MKIVILDTMWGTPNGHRILFRINPLNKSGRLLHRIIDGDFLVGNACPGIANHATVHHAPSTEHLRETLSQAFALKEKIETLILGGKVAQNTWNKLQAEKYETPYKVRLITIPHPAARFWSHVMMDQAKAAISQKDGVLTDTWSLAAR